MRTVGDGIRIRVYGEPASQGSKLMWKHRVTGKPMMREQTSEKLNRWRSAVVEAIQELGLEEPWLGPVMMQIIFYLPKPAKTKFARVPWGTPDIDKLTRAVGDCLSKRVIVDDSQIVLMHVAKRWAEVENEPGCLLVVSKWSDEREMR